MSHRVVITGMGIWSCLGGNKAEVTDSLRAGRSGIGIDPERTEIGFHSALTGIVPKPDLKPYLDRRMRHSMADETEYAYMASREAFEQAGIDDAYLENNEVGIIFGNDSTGKAVVETAKRMEAMKDSFLLGAGAIFQSMNSTVTMNLSTIFHLRGINFTISAACSSGAHSVGMAYLLIKQGLQEVVLAGGAQEVNPISMASFDGLNAFSKRMDEPEKASRPFDKNRDGLIPSGGGAALVLEDYDHAVHATSTILGDKAEAEALTQLFAGKKALISSTKSMTGHECWMSGASEIVYSLLMMKNRFVAPNINLDEPDEAAETLNIARQTVEKELHTVLSNSFGFGGTNCAIILKNIN